MRVNKKSSNRILSFMLAFALTLTMCIGFMPQKAYAEDAYAEFTSNGVNVGGDHYGSGQFVDKTADYTKYASYDSSNKEFILTDAQFTGFDFVDKVTIVIKGNCALSTSGVLYLFNDSPIPTAYSNKNVPIVIKMTEGSTLKINKVIADPNGGTTPVTITAGSADWNKLFSSPLNLITVEGGDVGADGTITANGNASSGGSNENTGTDIKVGDTVTPKDGSSKDSATYKVTGTDKGKRSVTYEKPAENASGTEEIKASVILKDGNEYKVTAIGDGAFKNFEKKDDIAKIIIGDNVEQIGKSACEDLKNVKEIKIGKNVKKIGAKAFKGCVALTKCDVPDNVEEIGESANEGCKKLTKLTIGRKVKKIGKKAYYQSGLKNIKVKSSKLTKASKIGKNAFGKINKKAKVKMKMTKSEARKAKAPTIKVFKNKKIGYVKTWSVS
ncbi:leucine-rich repeat domain-containing protein [Butyrivibrio sp. WCD3002]|uniref:leucine-rich repeat domain-containing protein n=1 Tax=Butyrivibrio sp. WCD3002 TaxID=1280676 RepID=UPI000402DE61|nr:leucine-rich repeat domain-containing protein [Butyrivibrio sp. WCD3002]